MSNILNFSQPYVPETPAVKQNQAELDFQEPISHSQTARPARKRKSTSRYVLKDYRSSKKRAPTGAADPAQDLVTRMSQITISPCVARMSQPVTSRKKRSNSANKMQVDPSRTQPQRQAKPHLDGQLDMQRLLKRTTGTLEASKPTASVVPKTKPLTPDEMLASMFDPADPYALIRIDQNAHNENIQCDVCLEYEDGEGDEIVICELCLGATHQSCHGGSIKDRLPALNEPWYCDRCQYLLQHKAKKCTEVRCLLCPSIDGIMRQTSPNSNEFAHVVCVNWTPGVWYRDDTNNQVDGNIASKLDKVRCTRCKDQRGACIPCEYKNCPKSYHVRCAIKMGMISELEQMQNDLGNPQTTELPVFCQDHAVQGQKLFMKEGIQAVVTKRVARKSILKMKGPNCSVAERRPKIGRAKAGKQVAPKVTFKQDKAKATKTSKASKSLRVRPTKVAPMITKKVIGKSRTRGQEATARLQKVAIKSGVHQKNQSLKRAGKQAPSKTEPQQPVDGSKKVATDAMLNLMLQNPLLVQQMLQQVSSKSATPMPLTAASATPRRKPSAAAAKKTALASQLFQQAQEDVPMTDEGTPQPTTTKKTTAQSSRSLRRACRQ